MSREEIRIRCLELVAAQSQQPVLIGETPEDWVKKARTLSDFVLEPKPFGVAKE